MKLRARLVGERSEVGETLLEVLIASALMAIVIVGLLGGLGSTVVASSLHRDQTKANTVLVAAMENVKSSTRVACGNNPPATYLLRAQDPVKVPLPAGWNASQIAVTDVAYQTNSSVGTVGWGASCSDLLPLQRITITVTSLDGRAKPSLTFVKGAI